jgi:hypothetical protein
MSTIGELIEAVKRVDVLLADADLEPRAERDDWASAKVKVKVATLKETTLGEIATLYESAREETEDTELGPMISRRVAYLYSEVAAVLQASGDGIRAAELLAKAERMTPDEEQKALLVAGLKEPAVFTRVMLSTWLLNDGRWADGDREAKRAKRETRQPAISARAKKILSGARPLEGPPPTLSTVNGIGTSLYGSRDRDEEGRYVATYCICLLFIPVFPLAAYRVESTGHNSYRFFAKEKLSSFARGYQAVVGLAIVALVAGYGINSYLSSPERLARIALDDARAAEQSGDDEQALEGYRRVVTAFSVKEATKAAASGIARLSAKAVPAPCTQDSVEPVRRAVNAFASLSESARANASAEGLAKRLDACATEIGDGDGDRARAALRVLDLASDVVKGGPDQAFIDQRRAAARRAFALQMAESRPLMALVELAKLSDKESVEAAKKIVLGLGDGPSLWVEAQGDIEQWAKNARQAGDAEGASAATSKLSAATSKHKESAALIEAGDDKAIAKASAAAPDDQELCVAVASAKRVAGDSKGAFEMMKKLGPPGRLTARAQELLATLHSDAGELAKADEILSALVDERLPAFQDAQRVFLAKASEVEDRLIADLKLGNAPPDLERRLTSKIDDAGKREEVHAWISEKLSSDPSLMPLRAEYLRRGQAVPASLQLGMVKLRRAAEAGGDERKRLLDHAERAFLAIRNEAAGDPTFHLGLGQVYHRLGKTEEGDKEMASVLERKEPLLALMVARTYRELGLHAQARKIARELHSSGAEEGMRYAAADLLAHMAGDLDEEEEWLRKADPTSPSVRVGLDRVAGDRLLREGKRSEADQKFKRCVEFFARDAKTSSVSANNAATELSRRYEATGDPAHLTSAASYLETASRLEPDNALILSNLSSALAEVGFVKVLDRWVDTRALAFDHAEHQLVIDALAEGPLAAELLEALRREPSFQRALDVEQKLSILAPQMRGAYRLHLRWARWNRDIKALEELQKRIDLLPSRSDAEADAREKWLSGARDESLIRQRKAAVVQDRQRLDRAKNGSKATQAAAWLALTDTLEDVAFFEHGAAQLDEWSNAAQQAHTTWPEAIPGDRHSLALAATAIFKAMESSPALKKAHEQDRRSFNLVSVAYRASTGPSGADVLVALRKEPSLAEAAAVRKRGVSDRPAVADFLVAKLAGDAELEQAASKAFDRAELILATAIACKLDPADQDDAMQLAILRSRGAAQK